MDYQEKKTKNTEAEWAKHFFETKENTENTASW